MFQQTKILQVRIDILSPCLVRFGIVYYASYFELWIWIVRDLLSIYIVRFWTFPHYSSTLTVHIFIQR